MYQQVAVSDAKYYHTTSKEAEMIKCAQNTMLASRVSLANMIFDACEENNIDSLFWTPSEESDSIRIRVRDPDSYNEKSGKYDTEDISGWYFSVTGSRAAKMAGAGSEIRSNGKGFNK